MDLFLIVVFLILVAIVDDSFGVVVVELSFLLYLWLRVRPVEGVRELLFDFFYFGEEHIDGGGNRSNGFKVDLSRLILLVIISLAHYFSQRMNVAEDLAERTHFVQFESIGWWFDTVVDLLLLLFVGGGRAGGFDEGPDGVEFVLEVGEGVSHIVQLDYRSNQRIDYYY